MFLPELIDQVIDELQWDEKALVSVSLVSRAWIPRSRKHLFRTLHLIPLSRSGSQRRPALPVRLRTKAFIDLCSHPLSTILDAGPIRVILTTGIHYMLNSYAHCCTNALNLDRGSNKRIEDHILAFTNLVSWLRATASGEQGITYAQRLFKNVRYLTLPPVQSDSSIEELIGLLLSQPFPNITQLTIDAKLAHSPKLFPIVTSSFKSVKRLFFTYTPPSLTVGAPMTQVSFPPSLTHIEIGMSCVPSITLVESCSTLEHLTIQIEYPNVGPQITSAINRFLETSIAVKNTCLKHCELVLSSRYRINQSIIIDRLSKILHFNRIESWTLDAHYEAIMREGINAMPNVTTVVLRGFQEITDSAIVPLDRTLSGSSLFPGLRDVEIPISHYCDRETLERSGWHKVDGSVVEGSEAHRAVDEMVKQIRSNLHECDSKGLLKIHVIHRPDHQTSSAKPGARYLPSPWGL